MVYTVSRFNPANNADRSIKMNSRTTEKLQNLAKKLAIRAAEKQGSKAPSAEALLMALSRGLNPATAMVKRETLRAQAKVASRLTDVREDAILVTLIDAHGSQNVDYSCGIQNKPSDTFRMRPMAA